MTEKIIYDESAMRIASEAQQSGVRGVSYEDFRKRRADSLPQSDEDLEKISQLQNELHKIQGSVKS